MDRFLRTELLLGGEALEKLSRASVVVAGLGAVGGYAVEALARAGVGKLRLADMDVLKKSNINRQLYALESTLGCSKADEAARRVHDINPDCEVTPLKEFVHRDTMDSILEDPVDFVIDALDSLNPKIELLTACYSQRIPVVSSMGAALRTDVTKIRSGDIFDTYSCPLAKIVRKRLRNRKVGRGILCVFSTEHTDFQYGEPVRDSYKRGRDRRVLGSLPTIPGIYGLMLAHFVIQRLTGNH